MAAERYIDASLFMGMHSVNEAVRLACKTFFAERMGQTLVMSLEHVGRCDDLVWRYPRAIQDEYYPFMDNLHTDAAIRRIGYDEKSVRTAQSTPELAGLDLGDRLLLGMVLNGGGELHTVNPRLTGRPELPVRHVASPGTARFPALLETLYERSRVLRVAGQDW
ncbi:DUF6190 family protein [Amycolatopsis nigrescens]|uniref:DUF6190 family protein n=1 Tax=Amycolatopsis nigrescens TaxID=381445 RepID=UPI000368F742|nr:DUF6190 family protein [Amycolatopsis nigrescens]